MRKSKLSSAVLLFFILTSALHSGCALFLLGTGAAGGYAISKDEIEGLTDSSYDKAWNASKQIIREEGAPTLEDRTHGKIEAVVGGSTVELNVAQVTAKTVRLRVKARKSKGLFPDIKLAQQLYTRIIKKVE